MKKNMYLCIAVVMIFLVCSGCGRGSKAAVFELEGEGADSVSSQDGGGLQPDRDEWKAMLEEVAAAIEVRPVVQVTCNCTGETRVQEVSADLLPRQEGAAENRVNINTADAQTLQGLNGIGESRAQAIIAYRESCGGFGAIEDIMQVDGIKEGVFNKIKDEISVG